MRWVPSQQNAADDPSRNRSRHLIDADVAEAQILAWSRAKSTVPAPEQFSADSVREERDSTASSDDGSSQQAGDDVEFYPSDTKKGPVVPD